MFTKEMQLEEWMAANPPKVWAMRRFTNYRPTRCDDGRLMRHDPQPDDPSLETDIGKCPECEGEGCICECCGDDLIEGRCEACAMAEDEGREFAKSTPMCRMFNPDRHESNTEKRIELLKLLVDCRRGAEKPGETILRALRLLTQAQRPPDVTGEKQ